MQNGANTNLTVKDLKKQLEGLSNDIVIWIGSKDNLFPVANYGGLKLIKIEGKPALFFDNGQ